MYHVTENTIKRGDTAVTETQYQHLKHIKRWPDFGQT